MNPPDFLVRPWSALPISRPDLCASTGIVPEVSLRVQAVWRIFIRHRENFIRG